MSLSYIPRVTQLDARQLDEQVEDLLKQQLLNATKFLEPGYFQQVLPELELILRTWIFKYSLWNRKMTFGQQMLSLKYKTEHFSRSKLYWYYGYTIGLQYLKDRAIYSFTSNTSLQNAIHKLETFQLFGDIINFLRFIQDGKYPELIDFILGLQLYADKLTREDLTDLTWTRELLWHNFIELIGTAISLLNIFGLKGKLGKIVKYGWWRKPVSSTTVLGDPVMTASTVCVFCSNKPVLPHSMGCPHLFCYYCLVANKTADQGFACPKCSYNGKEMKKYIVL